MGALYLNNLQDLSLTNTLTVQERSRTVKQLLGRRQTGGETTGSSGCQGQAMAERKLQNDWRHAIPRFIYCRQTPATYMTGQSNQGSHLYLFLLSPSATMIFLRASLALLVVSVAALFCAQSVEAAKGPKITHKVYFDIKQGDENLGRSAWLVSSLGP